MDIKQFKILYFYQLFMSLCPPESWKALVHKDFNLLQRGQKGDKSPQKGDKKGTKFNQ
jgi:hypothetical protein